MKFTSLHYLLSSLLLTALVAGAHGEEKKDVVIRHVDRLTPRITVSVDKDPRRIEIENVTFLGVETGPVGRTLSAQLGLPRDVGLVVSRVADGSPAASVLKENDILTKFEDQILVDPRQLSVLIRAKKDGDEVALTVYRGGKESVLKVKLGQREVTVGDTLRSLGGSPDGGMQFFNLGSGGELRGLDQLRQLPGMGRGDLDNVMRMISRERGNLLGGPGSVHVFRRNSKGSTILDLPKGNFVYNDDDGIVELKSEDDKRTLTVKDAKGQTTFNGPVNTEEDRKKIPADVMARLGKIELSFEIGDDFEQEGATVDEAKPKQKINLPGSLPLRRGGVRQQAF